ncbi:protein phosphatase 1 regulatory subunit 35 [Bombina bombina]|uniref:protein phosphatase 1 regulatory subunit 35 n=1 Tax=Bombina bombina TaxID=8345 RepID=UPI00235B1556|nr:protein phosphatase 1 regulatory subunit 35 [Bombina bombina]
MSQTMSYTPQNYLGEDEGEILPFTFAPQPLTLDPRLPDSHPLLDISLTPEKNAGILRRENSDHQRGQRQVRFNVTNHKEETMAPTIILPTPGLLEVPRKHSSIALEQEVQNEAEQKFDAMKAVQSELERSYRARRLVENKAAKALNMCRVHNLYQGLVSVEPPAEQIQKLAEKERQRRVECKEVTQIEGPDIFIFSQPSDIYTETPYLNVEGLPPLTLLPRTRPSRSTFDMHNKLREWSS